MPGEPSFQSPSYSPPDLSHHLSIEARARLPNPMKAIWKVAQGKPGAISLANGDPHHSLYPIHKMEFEIPSIASEDPVRAWRAGTGGSQIIGASRDDPGPSSSRVSLNKAMAYTTGAGLPETQDVLAKFTDIFHHPPNHRVTPSLGNFDAVTKCFRLLGEHGDSFLADEYTFSALTNAALPHGIRWVPVEIDAGGLIPDKLDALMQGWNTATRGRKPHVLYLTPSGQNPTGSTLTLERRQRIYALCRKWDLIIIEDDPYYFLQYEITAAGLSPEEPGFATRYAKQFTPSFLSMDVDGRVLRIDSFSKILAPGMRLGWITASPLFTEKLVIYTDSSTMHPHGFGQVFVLELLGERGWGVDGFARWLSSLREDYKRRRDAFLQTFQDEVEAKAPGLAEISPPQAGMFFWIKVNLQKHPRAVPAQSSNDDASTHNASALMEELFYELLEAGLVMMPASIFAIKQEGQKSQIEERLNYFRATFAGTEETVKQGLSIFGPTLSKFFRDEKAA
ncbi:L-tyrosine:2-oxoglutarate aminotransferase [Punctularia strigosozonata HHB-11173 SS5]|uniref:L-tyrosine:2-oxoglutarate aminotransferase n=1 Tax=Punctularia strigosozonata (strain HHB-11173) TaxID=741275 RepID=UPI0004416A32|nr:L-tyrosine:2-oxoglutarate aminotransferase [Punctularia strigosozonata HHB-11173 SS5]EIN07053.1 L-tyrosine:2-oxoglutarate aminotransferase [Punctularia strigosozonata HHB-11173 SS5]